MATLQKFKLLATQCALAASPSRSPNTSPVLDLRHRRTTLGKLLKDKCRSGNGRLLRRGSRSDRQPDPEPAGKVVPNQLKEVKKKGFLSHSLKDLFVSSPPLEDSGDRLTENLGANGNRNGFPSAINRGYPLPERGFGGRKIGLEVLANGLAKRAAAVGGVGLNRRHMAGFRYRLLRKAWRPVLVSIPE